LANVCPKSQSLASQNFNLSHNPHAQTFIFVFNSTVFNTRLFLELVAS
jgi:hypothetical protein